MKPTPRTKRALQCLVTVALLSLALAMMDREKLGLAVKKLDARYIVLATALSLAHLLVMGRRWYWLCRGAADIPFGYHMACYLYGCFLNTFTPGNLGGDVYRVFALRRHGQGSVATIVAVLRERWLGVLAYLLTYVAAIAWIAVVQPQTFVGPGKWLVVGAAAAVGGLVCSAFASRLVGWAERHRRFAGRARARSVLASLRAAVSFDSPLELMRLLGLSLLALGLWIVAVRVVAMNLHVEVSTAALCAIVVLVELIRFVPISMQGIGVREGVFAYSFFLLGYGSEDGFVLGAVAYLALGLSLLLCGLFGYLLRRWLPESFS